MFPDPRLVEFEGQTLTVEDAGPSDGFPFLVHHGGGSRHLEPAAVRDAHRHGLRLISYDRPAYGGSTAMPGRVIADCKADVEAIMNDLGVSRMAVWGFSGGGPYALATAALLPEAVAAVCVLAGCGYGATGQAQTPPTAKKQRTISHRASRTDGPTVMTAGGTTGARSSVRGASTWTPSPLRSVSGTVWPTNTARQAIANGSRSVSRTSPPTSPKTRTTRISRKTTASTLTPGSGARSDPARRATPIGTAASEDQPAPSLLRQVTTVPGERDDFGRAHHGVEHAAIESEKTAVLGGGRHARRRRASGLGS
jgi:pimeloyl-ACP methyl ester carboxylesterase